MGLVVRTKGIKFSPITEFITSRFLYKNGSLYWSDNFGRRAVKGTLVGGLNAQGYRVVGIKRKYYMVHRIIWAMHYGDTSNIVDHIDGDISNNSLSNLREATYEQSARNISIKRTSSTGVKNVQPHSQTKNKWQVFFSVAGKKKYFGIFNSIKEAEAFAIKKRKELHKDFARHA